MSLPKISIITPSLNQAEFLEQTILSVINQNYPNLEYIIIDGGSTDGSVDIIKKYEKHLTYWISEKDNGQSHAINKGLAKATGEIINWLNSDDYYTTNALAEVVEVFTNKNILVVCGRSKILSPNGKHSISQGTKLYNNNIHKALGWIQIDQPATFFRKSALEIIGLLNENLHYVMDAEWWMKYLLAYGMNGIKEINTAIVNFRIHPSSKTASQFHRFIIERDSIFHALSLKFNLLEKANFITAKRTLLSKYKLNLHFPLHPEVDIERTINYYFLLLGNEYYIQHDKENASLYFNLVKPTLLSEEDSLYWRKLYLRNKYLPTFIIKVFRKD